MVRVPAILAICCCTAAAQTARTNYPVPDPLLLTDGRRVSDVATWTSARRPELVRIFEERVFGKTPSEELKIHVGEVVTDPKALGGKAIRKQTTIYFSALLDGPQIHVLVYLPVGAKGPVPVFLGLNSGGNQTVNADPGILMNDVWIRDPAGLSNKMLHLPPDDRTRGAAAAAWQVEKIIARGFGVATVCYNDIEPDFDGGVAHGVRPLFAAGNEWSALGAWAWGVSRVVAFLITDARVDANRIAVAGHSQAGRAALWAAARDPRIAMVIVSEPGRSAVPLNQLLALVAPRPLYVSSVEGDGNPDARGEFLSATNVGQVYGLFGKKGLGTAVVHEVGYHARAGRHDVTDADWEQYLAFAEMQWGVRK